MREESVETIHHPKRAACLGTPAPKSHSRRKFMSQVGFTGAAALATGASRRRFLRTNGRLFVPAFAIVALLVTVSAWAQDGTRSHSWGQRYRDGRLVQQPERHPLQRGGNSLARLRHWNEIAINASGLDHTPVTPGESGLLGSRSAPAGQAGRWLSFTLRYSIQ